MPLKLNNRCNKINKVIDLIKNMNNYITLTTCPNKRLSSFFGSTLRCASKKLVSVALRLYVGSPPQANTLRKVEQRKPHEACYFMVGGQEGENLVTTNQHSINSECWALGACSIKEIKNDRVCVFGENQHKTTNQALQSFGSVASTVATHLAIVGRGFCLVPPVVLFKVAMHNPSIKRDDYVAPYVKR